MDDALASSAFAGLRRLEVNILLRVDLNGRVLDIGPPGPSDDEAMSESMLVLGRAIVLGVRKNLPLLSSRPGMEIELDSKPDDYYSIWS